ncbi:MAG: excinuclease ABC subunit UvrA [Deltaproteobacteria bacterium]|nr:excinuclease ABC subunit UvrA [Deltaproteobacteria bacterium]
MGKELIVIRGAREHNLKNIDLDIPRDRLTVITGLSGSGKSSLAFDTIYAEGQRRYVESLSTYARQFLVKMDKPDVDMIDGLSPAIAIEQKTTSHNPRSTVGTVTEIHDFLRLLFARVGEPHCHKCGRPIKAQTVVEMVDRILALPTGTRLMILAPMVTGRKGDHAKLLERLKRDGFVRVLVDAEILELDEDLGLNSRQKHDISVVVDRLVIKNELTRRLTDSVELALKTAEGALVVAVVDEKGQTKEELFFSEKASCDYCGVSLPNLTPQLFSFNSPSGACPSCLGLGRGLNFDPDLVIDPELSLANGAVIPWGPNFDSYYDTLRAMGLKHHWDMDAPYKTLPEEVKNIILYSDNGEEVSCSHKVNGRTYTDLRLFEGVFVYLSKQCIDGDPRMIFDRMRMYMRHRECPDCHGDRLKPEALAVKVAGQSLADLSRLSTEDCWAFFQQLDLGTRRMAIAERIIKEIVERLGFLRDVGLGYLTLSRAASTLSGGESQRIRLATQIGSPLVGVTYILDEPSIGLHQRDNQKLLTALKKMRDQGNTIMVVEHDAETIEAADYVIDLGPGAGELGGELICVGPPEKIAQCPSSLTGQYLSGRRIIPFSPTRRKAKGHITIKGARIHNLKDLTVSFPLGVFTCVTGVSGSGKSSLVLSTLSEALSRGSRFYQEKSPLYDAVEGVEQINKVIDIDQSPIGRTPRSNPATYIGLFTPIRDIFHQLPEARARGYLAGRFSFNVKGGRCETCQGDGIIKIEMHFLPDVYVKCEACHGRRYNRDTLEIKYNGASIADVLDMTVSSALDFFQRIPHLRDKLSSLSEVGLGYIRLGQSSTTLSGGEAQRVKLSKELSRRGTGRTVYILDEPTTGLHFEDVRKLLELLQKLVEQGNTVIVIEHNLDVIKSADHVIDLGPEGGDGGGLILAEGTPEMVAKNPQSQTGQFLRKILKVKSERKD